MKLIEKIRADRIAAFKNKENIKKNILTCVITLASQEGKDPSDFIVKETIKNLTTLAQDVIVNTDRTNYDFFQATIEIDILEAYKG